MKSLLTTSLAEIQLGTTAVAQGVLPAERFYEGLQATHERRAGGREASLGQWLLEQRLIEGPALARLLRRLAGRADDSDSTIVIEGEAQAGASVARRIAEQGGPAVSIRLRRENPHARAEDGAAAAIARYRDVAEIARGGMGVILRGDDPDLNRTVAIKLLPRGAGASEYVLRKFLMEAQITGQLEHPNIVPLHELGLNEDLSPYFTMKLVKGRSLEELLEGMAERDPEFAEFNLPRLLRIFLKICDAVAFAHSLDVIHRDLKPANVMVGEFGEVLVMDWGLAAMTNDELRMTNRGGEAEDPRATRDGTVVGTPAYMPPEQARGEIEAVDRRSDIYSLGAMLYEILTLTPPYGGGNAWNIVAQVTRGELEPPSARAAGVPRELEAVVLKAMAREPEQRYQQVRALKQDIQAFLDGHVLSAARYTPLQRLGKWIGRHKAASLAALVVVLATASLAGLYRWQRRQELKARERRTIDQIARIEQEVEPARARLAGASRLVLRDASGALAEEAVAAWFAAHGEVIDLLDRRAALDASAPTPRARRAVDLEATRGERQRLCRAAWEQATGLELYTLARTWVGRAVGAGLDATGQRKALDWIERQRRERIEASLKLARNRLAETVVRSRQWNPADWVTACVNELLRHRGPELVALLLDPRYLDSPNETVQLLVIETLGRLGDTRTRGPEGTDPVAALCKRLRAIDLVQEQERAAAIARALVFLRDPRAYDVVFERLQSIQRYHPFHRDVGGLLVQLPLPGRYRRAPATAARPAEELLRHGQVLIGRGQFAQGLQFLDQAVARDPRLLAAWHARGREHAARGRPDAALADYGRALALDPRHVPALLDRAALHESLRRYDQALADVERVVSLRPDDHQAYLRRGMVKFAKRDAHGALDDFTRASRLEPRDPEPHVQRGRLLRAARQPGAALEAFNHALMVDPRASYAYLYRGLLRLQRKDPQGAVIDFTTCVRVNGSHVSAYFQRGQVFTQLGKLDRARRDFERCTEVQKHFWQGWWGLGVVLARQGKKPEARRALAVAESYAPAGQKPAIRRQIEQLR